MDHFEEALEEVGPSVDADTREPDQPEEGQVSRTFQ